MAIKGKRNIGRGETTKSTSSSIFLKSEALFIGQKLQQANFKGEEFETYQQIMFKLKSIVDKG